MVIGGLKPFHFLWGMKGRLYVIGVIGAIMIALGLLLEIEVSEALQWMGTGMLVSFVFLITYYQKNPDIE